MNLEILTPPAVRPGDVVRVVSPSGPPEPERLSDGVKLLEQAGFTVEVSEHACDRHGYLAGTDEVRLAEFNAALREERVRAVICARGGYGAGRIVDGIDFEAARDDPKPVTGYSDVTAIHSALYARSGLVGIHGPVLTSFAEPRDPVVAEAFLGALTGGGPITVRPRPGEPTAALTRGTGAVRGRLLGGNLSLTADAIGTESAPDYSGAIVFCEEVNEEPYRLDRILTQLRRSGALDGIVGIALGQFTGCADADWDWDVLDTLRDRLGDLGVPILGGLPLGHGDDPLTVPFGAEAELDSASGTLTVAPAVS